MASKPADLPIHATDASYPMDGAPEEGAATKVAPVLGKKQLGSRPAEKPPAQSENWWKNLVYQWCAYLGDGELAGDHLIDGALTVAGPVVAQDDLQVGINLEVLGDATAPDWSFTTPRSRRFPGGLAWPGIGTGHTRMVDGWLLADGGAVHFPISVETGERIGSWSIAINKTSSGAQTLEAYLMRKHEDHRDANRRAPDEQRERARPDCARAIGNRTRRRFRSRVLRHRLGQQQRRVRGG
jgi:hypothetical protein